MIYKLVRRQSYENLWQFGFCQKRPRHPRADRQISCRSRKNGMLSLSLIRLTDVRIQANKSS